MALALFDLDNTLLGGDSDHAWGEFACELEIVDPESFGRANDTFFEDYKAGRLDIEAYVRHALSPLKGVDLDTVAQWHQQFMTAKIEPMLLPAAQALLEQHREAGDHLLIITATSRFITAPIARLMAVEDLLACDAQIIDGRYTGEPEGILTYAQGKVLRLQQWLGQTGMDLTDSWFYSDSINDLPLLLEVDNPVAVDPDDKLRKTAEDRGWPVISLRQ